MFVYFIFSYFKCELPQTTALKREKWNKPKATHVRTWSFVNMLWRDAQSLSDFNHSHMQKYKISLKLLIIRFYYSLTSNISWFRL